MFDLLSRWFPSPRRPPRPEPAPVPQGDEPVYGCGWFDSSHDLVQGAHVVEVNDAATPLWHIGLLAQA